MNRKQAVQKRVQVILKQWMPSGTPTIRAFARHLEQQTRCQQWTLTEAAGELGVSRERVRQLCVSGRLAAERRGNTWLIDDPDLQAFARLNRPSGRPPGSP